MLELLFRLSLRMVIDFIESLINLFGLDWAVLDYSNFCNRQKYIDIAIRYQKNSKGLYLFIVIRSTISQGEIPRRKRMET